MRLSRPLAWLVPVLLAFAIVMPARAEEPVRVFAAASLTNALEELATQWQAKGHPKPVLAFGASSTLAKQVHARVGLDAAAASRRR